MRIIIIIIITATITLFSHLNSVCNNSQPETISFWTHQILWNVSRAKQTFRQSFNVTAVSYQWRHIREPYTEEAWTVSGSGVSSLQYGNLTVTISIFHWHAYQHCKPKLQIATQRGCPGLEARLWAGLRGRRREVDSPLSVLGFLLYPQSDETFLQKRWYKRKIILILQAFCLRWFGNNQQTFYENTTVSLRYWN